MNPEAGISKSCYTGSPEDIDRFAKDSTHTTDSQIVFMRGYPHAAWLDALYEKYDVDPYFFQTHLQSLPPFGSSKKEYYTPPTLQSDQKRFFP